MSVEMHSIARRPVPQRFMQRMALLLVVAGNLAGCSRTTPPPTGTTTGSSSSATPSAPAVGPGMPTPTLSFPTAVGGTNPSTGALIADENLANLLMTENPIAKQTQVWILVPAAPHLSGMDGDTPGAPGAVPPEFPEDAPRRHASGIELPWASPANRFEDDFARRMHLTETPLAEQSHRHAAELLHHSDATVPEPIAKMESFTEGLAEIKRRWLKASSDRNSIDSIAHEADQFDQMVGSAKSVTELEDDLRLGRAFKQEELIRLLGLFGENASGTVPALVNLVRRRFEKSEPHVLGYDGGVECAQALANIGSASVGEIRVLLREGTGSEKRFAMAIIGLLGERASTCVPELLALLDSEDPAMVDAALWGLAAVGPGAVDAVPRVVRILEQAPALSQKAAGVLYSIGSAASDETLKLVEAVSSPTRLPAVFVLGTIGKDNPRVTAALGRLLNDSDPLMQSTAIIALAGQGDSAKPAIPKLIAQLRGPHALTAAKTLGTLGDTAAVAIPDLVLMATTATVMRPLQGWETHEAIIKPRLVALDAIASIGSVDASSMTVLVGLLQDPRMEGEYADGLKLKLRCHTANTLGTLGRVAVPAVPQLLAVIEKPLTGQRGQEERAGLRQVNRLLNPNNSFTLDVSLRLVALQSLGMIGDKSSAVLRVCNQSLQDADPAIRTVAVKSLVELGQSNDQFAAICQQVIRDTAPHLLYAPKKTPAPTTYIDKHSDHVTLFLVGQTFVALGETAIPSLIEIANSREVVEEGHAAAIYALGKVGSKSAEARRCITRISLGVPDLILSEDEAKRALVLLGDDTAAQVEALISLLNDADVAKLAAGALATYGADAASAVPKLMEQLKSENVDVRINVVKTLGAIGPSADGVQPALLAAMKDDELRVQQAAFEGICRIGPAAAPHASVLIEYASRRPIGIGGTDNSYVLANLGTEALLPVILPKLGNDQSARQLFAELSFRNRRPLKGEANAKLLAGYLTDENVEVRQLVAQTLRMEMGEEARPVVDELKKAARDKDTGVAWQAAMTLLELLPLDDVIAAVPAASNVDPLKGKADQILDRLLAPGQPSEETMKMMPTLRQEAPVGYWVRSLKKPDPQVRFLAAWICQLRHGPSETVLKSVIEDKKTTPKLKAFAEQALKQAEQSRAQYGR